MILLVIFIRVVALCLIWNVNVGDNLAGKISFLRSLIQFKYELIDVFRQTFPQSMFQVVLFCSRRIFDS